MLIYIPVIIKNNIHYLNIKQINENILENIGNMIKFQI